eukprot:TRINITY_DN416_c0_g1_i5.p3 TRINITY_DN416_c0_g1~~TRINITY_DN416_c0_g1_i5.p3  ORF type:complete len:167 (+),score=45.99 TRINITY_DN416_c0_g1_i5:113-613(+)
MKNFSLIVFFALLAFTEFVATLRANTTDAPNACQNDLWDLKPLMRDEDYESGEFDYMYKTWVVVFNFCRDTERSCLFTHFPAYMNSPDRGFSCLPTLTSGSWKTADYGVEYISGARHAKVSWASKLKGRFEMWIKCNPETEYQYKSLDISGSPWRMYMESKYVCHS